MTVPIAADPAADPTAGPTAEAIGGSAEIAEAHPNLESPASGVGVAFEPAAAAAPDAVAALSQTRPAARPVAIHPRHGQVIQLVTAVWTVFVYGICAIPLTLVLARRYPLALVALALGGPLLLLALLGLVRGRIRAYRVARVPDGLLIWRGVWWRSETFVPGSRIQHTDVTSGPLDRRWGMAKLVLHTAGVELGEIGVPGLHHGDAVALRDELLERSGPDGI